VATVPLHSSASPMLFVTIPSFMQKVSRVSRRSFHVEDAKTHADDSAAGHHNARPE
jgi:hypothetical protein